MQPSFLFKCKYYNRSFVLQAKESINLNNTHNTFRAAQTVDEESSYSSSYSSFFKTDTGSGSNDDSNVPENKVIKRAEVTMTNCLLLIIILSIFRIRGKSPEHVL